MDRCQPTWVPIENFSSKPADRETAELVERSLEAGPLAEEGEVYKVFLLTGVR
jgi:hypothetical protein